jgi:hypothetical protein
LQDIEYVYGSDSSVVKFKPRVSGSGTIIDSTNIDGFQDTTGVITVTNTAAVSQIRIKSVSGVAGDTTGGFTLTTDRDTTLFVGGYDSFDNYIGDVLGTWYTSGTLDSTKLTPKTGSAVVFAPNRVNQSGRIYVRFQGLVDSTDGDVLTDTGAVAFIQVQKSRFDINSKAGSDTLTTDSNAVKYYVGAYDADSNFAGPVVATWSVLGGIGNVTSSAGDSTEFNARRVGEGQVRASYLSFTAETGLLKINVGDTTQVVIRTAPDNGGQRYDTQTVVMPADSSLNLYAAGYDADSNYISDIVVRWDTLGAAGGLSNFTTSTGTSKVYTPTLAGSDRIEAVYVNGDLRDTTGQITVVAGDTSEVRIVDARGAAGVTVGALSRTADDTVLVYAAVYDNKGNFISNVDVAWSVTGGIGTLSETFSDSTILRQLAVGSGVISANFVSQSLTDQTGLITVTAGQPDSLRQLVADSITLSPGQQQLIRVRLIDSLKNAIRDSVIHFAINSGSGTLSQSVDTTDALGVASVTYTTPTVAGVALVDVYLATLADTAKFTLTTSAGSLSYYGIAPSTTSDTAAAAITVTVTAFDVFGNQLDDDTTQTRLDVIGSATGLNGSGVGISSQFNTLTNGQHVAVVRDSVRETIQIRVRSRFDSTKSGTTDLITILPATPFAVNFYPDSVSNLQSGQQGAELIDSSAVIVTDRYGNAVNDTVTVRFIPLSNGSTSPSIRTTGTNGIARTKWTLRTTTASFDTMFAVVPYLDDSLRFVATILAAGVDSMTLVSVLDDTALVNESMSDTFRVKVQDQFNNPVTGRAITFSLFSSPVGTDSAGFVQGPGVYVSTLDTVTDADGFASAVFHTGTKVGTYIIRASNPALLNPVVRDTVYARHRPAVTLQLVKGNNQTVQVGSIATDTLVVQAFDTYSNAVTDTSARVIFRTIYNGSLPGGTGLVDALPYTPSVFVPIDSVNSNVQGFARAIWQVRRLTGTDSMLVFIRNVDTLLFTATTTAGSATNIFKVSGDSMTSIADGSSITLRTRVEDNFGNLVSNAIVRYSVTTGNARFIGADSSFTNTSGISSAQVQLLTGDSVTVQAQAGSGIVDFRLYNLVYVDSSLFPDQIARDTTVQFRIAVRNNGPFSIRLDSNQTKLRFTDGIQTFSVHGVYADSVIPGFSVDTLTFISDTISVDFLGASYTPKIDIKGKIASSQDSLFGTLETNTNELAISAVELVSITITESTVSRGDTIIVTLDVRNASNSNLTTVDYGLRASTSGVFQRIGTISLPVIPPLAPSTLLRDTIRILPGAPTGLIVFDGFYLGTTGTFTFTDTTATSTDSVLIESAASLRYLAGTLNPDTISEGQTTTFTLSIANDSAGTVNLNKSQTYLKFGSDSTFLLQSQGVTGGDTTVLTFASKALALTAGAYRGTLVLRGLENGGVFDTTLSVGAPGADSLVVQSPVNLASLQIDSIFTTTDTTAQGEDSLALGIRITNTAQANAVIDSIRLSFRRGGSSVSGYTAYALPTSSFALSGGTSQVINFFTSISSSADTGSVVIDASVGARDANSNTVILINNANQADSIFTRSRSRLIIASVTTPSNDTVTLGQSGIAINVTVTNAGGSPARVSDVRVAFKQGLYDTTLAQILPDTLVGYGSQTYNFTATVLPNSSIGLDSLGAEADGVDLLMGNALSVRATGLDTLRILTSTQMTLTTVSTVPLTVSRGQDSVLVRVTVRNTGASIGRLDSVRLLFFDEALNPNTTDFTVTPYSDVSDTVNAGVTKTFDFRVNLAATADTGRAFIDAVITGTDVLSGATFYDSAATTNDSWLVQFPTTLAVDTVIVTPSIALRGRQDMPVTVRIRNTGQATGTVDSVALVFFYGGTLNTTDFADTQTVPIGAISLAGGDSALYSYTVDVGSSAPTGFARVYAHAHGRDNNSSRIVVDTSRSKVDSVDIQTPPVLNYVLNTLVPDTVNNGAIVNFGLSVQNTGIADIVLNSSTELALLDVDSQKVNLPDTLHIQSGVTRTVVFNSVVINLREDSVYYPRLRYFGTAAGESVTGFVQGFTDSVKVLRGSQAVIDSFDVYRLDGTLTTTIPSRDSFLVRMKVKNTGGSTINDLAPVPTALTRSGTTIPFLLSGPTPAMINLAAGDSIRFEWRFRVDSSGSANFAGRAEGLDNSNDSLIASNTATAFLTVTAAPPDTLLAVTPLQDSVLVYNFIDLSVQVLDEGLLPASSDSVRFRVTDGAGGFNDTSRVTTDSITVSNTEGFATMRLFTNTLVDTYRVVARLLSTTDDSVVFTVRARHQGISFLTMTVNSNWTAGTSENILVQAFDQFGNSAQNSTQTIQLSAVGSSSIQYTPISGSLPLSNGQASFNAVDTIATSFMQIRATVTALGTEVISSTLNVRHAAAYRFADTLVVIANTRVGNSRVLTTTVLDRYGNPVQDTTVTFAVDAASNGGTLLTPASVTSDANGKVSATYKTGNDVGLNQVRAYPQFGAWAGEPDSVYWQITTLDFDANAIYEPGTLQPRVVSQGQIVPFRATFRNTGNFPLTLRYDSTFVQFINTMGTDTFRALLDTTVNRTIAVNGLSQIFFLSDTVDIIPGRYPSGTDSARIFLWGTILDSASGELDTLRFTFGNNILDTVRVLQPAQLVVDSVRIVELQATRGQDSIEVRYYVRNTGEVTATGLTIADSAVQAGTTVTGDWVFLGGTKPDTLAPTGATPLLITQYYRIRSAATLGTHVLSSRVRGIDKNNTTHVTLSDAINQDSIGILTPGNVQVVQTVVDSVYNSPFINVSDSVRIRTIVQNFGQEPANFRAQFSSDVGGFAYTMVTSVAANGSVILTTPRFLTRSTPGVEIYSVLLDSVYGTVSNTVLAITDSIAGNTRTLTVQDSAKLRLNMFVLSADSLSLDVSNNSYFSVQLTMSNLGGAPLSRDSAEARISIDPSFTYRFPSGVTDSVVFVKKDQMLSVRLQSFDTTLVPHGIYAAFDTASAIFPRDLNNSLKAALFNLRDSVRIQTKGVGALITSNLRPILPAGAVDSVVSTFQQFTLQAQISDKSRLSSIRTSLVLPGGFATADSLVRDVPSSPDPSVVTWRVFSTADVVGDCTFYAYSNGIDTSTGTVRNGDSAVVVMRLVRRTDLAMDVFISSPIGAIDDTVSTNQPLRVTAIVTNLGQAEASAGQLTLNPAGFTLNSPPTQSFQVGDSVHWDLTAPSVPNFTKAFGGSNHQSAWKVLGHLEVSGEQFSSAASVLAQALAADVVVTMSGIPNDTNTGLAAHVVNATDTVKVIVVAQAQIANLQARLPGNRDTVSTGQVFTLQASFSQLTALTNRRAELRLPAGVGYQLAQGDSLVKTIGDQDTSIVWSISAPDTIFTNQRTDVFEIKVSGQDKNFTGTSVSDSTTLSLTVQVRAQLAVDALIDGPLDAMDGFVSRNQTIRIKATAQNLGTARTQSQGTLRLRESSLIVSPNHRFVVRAYVDTIFNLSTGDNSAEWLITAPDTVIAQPLFIEFGSQLPQDVNTGRNAFIGISTSRLTVATETKFLRVTRVTAREDTARRTAYTGSTLDSMMVLLLENVGSSENSNALITQRFRFVVEQFDVGQGTYSVIPWDQYLSSVSVWKGGAEVGTSISPSGDTVVVEVSRGQLTQKRSVTTDDLSYGILTAVNQSDTVTFTVNMQGTAPSSRDANFRLKLVGVDVYDYDRLGDSLNVSSFASLVARDPSGRVIGVDPIDDFATGSLRVLDASNVSQQFYNYPNPFGNSTRLQTRFVFLPLADGNATIEIYTLTGRLVRKLTITDAQQGIPNESIAWDGRNGEGQKVRNGVYIAVLKAPNSPKRTTKIMIAR